MSKAGPLADIGIGLGALALGGAAGIGPLAGSLGGLTGATGGATTAGLGAADAAASAAPVAGLDAGASAADAGLGAAGSSVSAADAGLGLADAGLGSGASNVMALATDAGPASAVAPVATDATAGLATAGGADAAGTAAPDLGIAAGAPTADNPFYVPGSDAPLAVGGGAGSDFAGGPPAATNPVAAAQKGANSLLPLLPLLAMAGGLFGGNQVPGSGPVTAAATQNAATQGMLTGQAGQNISYVNTGALPAGAQATIDNAANAAKAEVRSSFASMGIPPGSSAEAQELAAVDQNKAEQAFSIQNKLLQSGVAEANSGSAYGQLVNQGDLALMQAQIQQNQALMQALSRFAAAAA